MVGSPRGTMDRGNQSQRTQKLANSRTLSGWFCHHTIGGPFGICYGQLCAPRNTRPPMAGLLWCTRPFSSRRSSSSSRTPPQLSSCSTSTNWPKYHVRRPSFLYSQPPTTTSGLLGSIRFPTFSRKPSCEPIRPLPSTSTSYTTYSDINDFYTTYNIGSDVSTSMACSVTSTSDFLTKLTYAYGLIRLKSRADKTTFAFSRAPLFRPELSCQPLLRMLP